MDPQIDIKERRKHTILPFEKKIELYNEHTKGYSAETLAKKYEISRPTAFKYIKEIKMFYNGCASVNSK
jgi:Mor family transcriptional regulator